MKRYTRYIIATFAAIASLVSCAKEPALVPEDSGLLPEGQMREIAVSFGASTKTTLNSDDGITPEFLADDVIKVSNATLSEDCTVKSIGGSLKIITRLSGTLTAVYPSTAANLSNPGKGNAPIKASPELPYKVSSTQSGLFKDANICTATISEGSTSASFDNVTPLLKFYVDESIGVQSLTITSTVDIASEGTDKKVITVTAPSGKTLSDVTTGNPDPRLCYIAILPDVNANTLTYTSVTTVQGQGTVTSTMTSDVTLTANHIYKAFIPYYIKVQVGTDDYQKWAYCNIGAFLPEEYGRYFAWGDTVGQTRNGTSWSGSGFSTAPDIGNPSTLPSQYDAANVNWGEKWRMPTKGEFTALLSYTGTTQTDFSSGILTVNGTQLKFPAGGSGKNSGFSGASGSTGFYWSSTLHTDNTAAATLRIHQCAVNEDSRFFGLSVRPIYDDFMADGSLENYEAEEFSGVPQDVNPLTGNFSVSATRKVKFSPANLRYTVATKQWSFFEHQYDCGASTYSGYHDNEISLFTWGKGGWSIIPNTNSYYDPEEDIQGTVYDWGTGKWRTLTYPEWKYLLYSRKITNDNVGFARAQVADHKGIIIFPDGYSGSTSGTGISRYSEDFPSANIPTSDWTAMETDGVVFLPAAGTRVQGSTTIHKHNVRLAYWTASYYTTNNYSYSIEIEGTSDYLNEGKYAYRGNGHSVRLVTDVTE